MRGDFTVCDMYFCVPYCVEMTTEVMGDAIDDAMEAPGEEEESEELVNQVLDELGCNMDAMLIDAPSGGGVKVPRVAAPQQEAGPSPSPSPSRHRPRFSLTCAVLTRP